MMTDKEIIAAQDADIKNLLAELKTLKESSTAEIERLKALPGQFNSEYKFGDPYFRLYPHYIYAYRLVNIVHSQWNNSYEPHTVNRFTEVFWINLDDGTINSYGGGNKALKVITYDDLKNRMLRRLKIATNKGDVADIAKWNRVLQAIDAGIAQHSNYFNGGIN